MEQPPTSLSCNPHRRLALLCRVEGPPQKFSIIWMREQNGKTMDISQQLDHATIHQSSSNFSSSIIGQVEFVRVASRLSLSPVSDEDTGQYWCEVRPDSGAVLAKRSNTFTLNTLEAYAQYPSCKGTNLIAQRDCAASMNDGVPEPLTTTMISKEEPDRKSSDDTSFFNGSRTSSDDGADSSLEHDHRDSVGSARIGYTVPVAVLVGITVTTLLILFVFLLRLKYCRGESKRRENEGAEAVAGCEDTPVDEEEQPTTYE